MTWKAHNHSYTYRVFIIIYMIMTKSGFVAAIADGTDLSKRQAADALAKFIEVIQASLEKGEEVALSGLGKFVVKYRPERDGRNPSTGETLKIAAKNAVVFKCAKPLKDAVNTAMPLKS